MTMGSTWHELAIETHMVIHIEQITDGAPAACYCGHGAVLFVTSEPDMEPGPVCAEHGWEWIDSALGMLRKLYPA